MNASEGLQRFLMAQHARAEDRPLTWHAHALDFIDYYGIDQDMIEAVIRRPQRTHEDPSGADFGYPVLRYRRGDVEVVVGYEFPTHPMVLYIHLHLPMEPTGGGAKTPGGRGTTAPTTVADLHARIRAQGYSITQGGKHMQVRDGHGALLCVLPSTPSDHRTMMNTWRQFLRCHALRSLDAER